MNKRNSSTRPAADKRTAADLIPSASLVQNGVLAAVVGGDTPIYGVNKIVNFKKDGKFSSNLYHFLTYKKKHFTNVFQDPENGRYYIGLRDEKGVWIGAKLMAVFCYGAKAETFSYPVGVSIKWNDVTKWFWSKYLEVGKEIYNLPEWSVVHQ